MISPATGSREPDPQEVRAAILEKQGPLGPVLAREAVHEADG
jgi:hypothetical protein